MSIPAATTIRLVDLHAQHEELKAPLQEAIAGVIESSGFILGPAVEAFEAAFADFCQVPHAVGLDSGISALELGLRALGIGEGDEVITPANSFIASSSAISFTGARPVWVDVERSTLNLDPSLVEAAITPRTRAIMVVHLYGAPANLVRIQELARAHSLALVEDACQAHGALYRGRRVGSFGDFGAFSFYPGKNLGAMGDAGVLTTSRPDLAEAVRSMRNYGQRRRYEHVHLAWNRRLDSIQAAVLRVKLGRLEAWNERRRRVAATYERELGDRGIELLGADPEGTPVHHLYPIRHPGRDALKLRLEERGIETGIHYPIPIHLQPCYQGVGVGPGSHPVTEAAARELLSLPMHPHLSESDVERVIEAVRTFSS